MHPGWCMNSTLSPSLLSDSVFLSPPCPLHTLWLFPASFKGSYVSRDALFSPRTDRQARRKQTTILPSLHQHNYYSAPFPSQECLCGSQVARTLYGYIYIKHLAPQGQGLPFFLLLSLQHSATERSCSVFSRVKPWLTILPPESLWDLNLSFTFVKWK